MIDTSPKMLMFIEPTKRDELPVRDAVTAAAKKLLKRPGPALATRATTRASAERDPNPTTCTSVASPRTPSWPTTRNATGPRSLLGRSRSCGWPTTSCTTSAVIRDLVSSRKRRRMIGMPRSSYHIHDLKTIVDGARQQAAAAGVGLQITLIDRDTRTTDVSCIDPPTLKNGQVLLRSELSYELAGRTAGMKLTIVIGTPGPRRVRLDFTDADNDDGSLLFTTFGVPPRLGSTVMFHRGGAKQSRTVVLLDYSTHRDVCEVSVSAIEPMHPDLYDIGDGKLECVRADLS